MAPWLPKNIWNPCSQVAWGESKQRSPLPRFCPRIPHHSSPLVNILPLGDLAYVLHIFLAQFYQIIKFLFGTQATRQVPACCMDILFSCSTAPGKHHATSAGCPVQRLLWRDSVRISSSHTAHLNKFNKFPSQKENTSVDPPGFSPCFPPTGNPGNLDPISPASSVSQ